jgi:hypothetical protein
MTDELDDAGLSRFRQLIGILRWAIELGRVDIYFEVAVLSQYLASPRQGHLEAVYHIFAYLKTHPKQKIVFDPYDPGVDPQSISDDVDWTKYYGEMKEELPPDMPEARGNPVQIHCFVDANHAGNTVTRRSHS